MYVTIWSIKTKINVDKFTKCKCNTDNTVQYKLLHDTYNNIVEKLEMIYKNFKLIKFIVKLPDMFPSPNMDIKSYIGNDFHASHFNTFLMQCFLVIQKILCPQWYSYCSVYHFVISSEIICSALEKCEIYQALVTDAGEWHFTFLLRIHDLLYLHHIAPRGITMRSCCSSFFMYEWDKTNCWSGVVL